MSTRGWRHAKPAVPDLVIDVADVVLELTGELDQWSVMSLRPAVEQWAGRTVGLDLTGVSFIDAAGVGCLVDLSSRNVRIIAAGHQVRRVFEIVGTLPLLDSDSATAQGAGPTPVTGHRRYPMVRTCAGIGRRVGQASFAVLHGVATRVVPFRLPTPAMPSSRTPAATTPAVADGYRDDWVSARYQKDRHHDS